MSQHRYLTKWVVNFIFVFCAVHLAGCAAFGQPNLRKIKSSELPTLEVDDADRGSPNAGSRTLLTQALERQKVICEKQDPKQVWDFGGKKRTRKEWCLDSVSWFLKTLSQSKSLQEVYDRAQKELEWYQSVGRPSTKDVLFTGYYHPLYEAKRTQDSEFKYPVYRRPSDLIQVNVNGALVWRRRVGNQFRPFFTRAEITAGALKGRDLEIAYLKNPVDVFILQVQGSGDLKILDEANQPIETLLNYDSQNGHAYVSLGKVMRERGVPEEYISLPGIRKYFTEVRPDLWVEYSNQNPSFVFFKEGGEGPLGSSGAVLTPKHSIAVDTKEFPSGVMGLIRTERPFSQEGERATDWRSFTQFVITQDTGGAIKSPGRVDIYWGKGEYAELVAGQTAHLGELYFALPPQSKVKKKSQ